MIRALNREDVSARRKKDAEDEFAAQLNLYVSMAHFIGKTLHIRPYEILSTWSTPELVVAFGYYADEISLENYEQYKTFDAKERAKMGDVKKYKVKFIGVEHG